MKTWESKGCETCRNRWLTGAPPPTLAVNVDLHSMLHHCEVCGAYWEQFDRYADVIAADRIKEIYGVDPISS